MCCAVVLCYSCMKYICVVLYHCSTHNVIVSDECVSV